jgi:hypothetical protein
LGPPSSETAKSQEQGLWTTRVKLGRRVFSRTTPHRIWWLKIMTSRKEFSSWSRRRLNYNKICNSRPWARVAISIAWTASSLRFNKLICNNCIWCSSPTTNSRWE